MSKPNTPCEAGMCQYCEFAGCRCACHAADAGPRQPSGSECTVGICENPEHRFQVGVAVEHLKLDSCVNWVAIRTIQLAAPPVPQEAAPSHMSHVIEKWKGDKWTSEEVMPRGGCSQTAPVLQRDSAEGRGAPSGQDETSATTPDWAMRVAEQIGYKIQSLLTYKYTNSLKIAVGIIRQELEADAALIREAGSERERELRDGLRELMNASNSLTGTMRHMRKNEQYLQLAKAVAAASRLLGGESK